MDPTTLARTTDPETSHEAAEFIVPKVNRLQTWAAMCVRERPGLTSAELAREYCPLDPRRIGRRLAECERFGMVRRGEARKCTVSGRNAATWYPTETPTQPNS